MTDRPAEFSRRVLLDAAAAVPGQDSESTADQLYHGNWLPLTPSWLSRFADDGAVHRHVVGDTDTSRWLTNRDAHWIHWQVGRREQRPGRFKVYVGVVPDELPAAFTRWVEILGAHRTHAFKLSRTPRGLLRPDRMVAYCADGEQAGRLVRALAYSLDGMTPHVVPFTAASPDNPAVSWAADPPAPVAADAGSWRRWVARRLAGYLHASDASAPPDRAAFAMTRLEGDGVDTGRWAPTPGLWAA